MKKLILLLLLIVLMGAVGALAASEEAFQAPAITFHQTYLNLGNQDVRDMDGLVRFLDKHPQLTKVDMYATTLKAEDADHLAVRYPDIAFGWTLHLVDEHVIRTDATAYAINHNNRSKEHTSEDFRNLQYCTNLKALDLGHNKITDISFLNNLQDLKVLIITCNKITDISPLANLKQLEYLELFKNQIADMSPLAGLSNLLDLNICHNKTDDLTPLYSLKGLERLWIYNSNNYSADDPLPEGRVQALQGALPDCYIDSTHYSTLGGWRTHPRYYVVFNMLHGELAWLPWSAEGLIPRYQ